VRLFGCVLLFGFLCKRKKISNIREM